MASKSSRREFLKTTSLAALASGVALSAPTALAGSDSPVPFKKWKTQWKLGEIGNKMDILKAEATPAICPYCSMGCSIDLLTIGDRIIHSRGSSDSYINVGQLCPKGQAAFQLIENELRVLTPMIRTGPKPPVDEILNAKTWDELVNIVKKYPPNWRPVGWDEAFRYIAERLKSIYDRHRAETGAPRFEDGFYYRGNVTPLQMIGSSVMKNEEGYLDNKLAVFLGTNNFDSQYRKCHSSTVTALALTYGWGAETASIEDVALSSVVMFFSNPAEAHPLSFYYFLQAKERGATFIVCDPRFSRTATYADLWVPFRSGADTALLYYLLYYAFFERNPPIDQLAEFNDLMNRWNITREDLEDLKTVIREYDVNTVSRISGVPVEKLRKMAELYVENSGVTTNHRKHGIIQWAMGFTQHTNASVNIIRNAAIVQMLLGNVGYPGGGTHPFRGHSNVQGVTDVQFGPGGLPGYPAVPKSTLEIRVYQDWKLQGMPDAWEWEVPQWARDKPPFNAIKKPNKGEADLAKALRAWIFNGWRRMELTWGIFVGTDPETDPRNGRVITDLPIGAGSSETVWPRRALDGEIKAAFILGENPAVTNPNAKIIWSGLASLELLVVADLFETETAWFADVLLPAAAWAEKEGVFTDGNRVLQWSYKALEPKGLSRPDYWIYTKLFEYLRRAGVIILPSELAGKKVEKVRFVKRGKVLEIYDRALDPDASWNYRGGDGAAFPVSPVEAEVNPRLIAREINFAMLIYQGLWDPIRDEFTPERRGVNLREEHEIDGVFSKEFKIFKNWGCSWPKNVRLLYNLDSLKKVLGKTVKIVAAGREWEVTGETGEILDEFTGEYRPFAVPGHNFFIPKIFRRRLSGVADLFGGVDMNKLIKEGKAEVIGKFVIEEGGEPKAVSFEEFVAKTGMKYLWANDTLYIDDKAQEIAKGLVKRPFFSGKSYREAKASIDAFKRRFREAYNQTRDIARAVEAVIDEFGRWYPDYNFQWPIHTEPVEAPDMELQFEYPTIAWLHPHNLKVLFEQPDVVKTMPVGVAHDVSILDAVEGELVVMTSHRLTETFHSGAMTRNVPYLAEMVPEPYVQIPTKLANKIGVRSGDFVILETARGSLRMRAFVTEGTAYLNVNGKELPIVSLHWSFSFSGLVTGAQANFLNPDVVDVKTTIQESKAWVGKIRRG
ncbi:MAG TPA: formate dehydrogenase [Candidatus Caldiarchaeum subterraneum]|uniref:Formate dehydrogenase n=1 Tax=Caldiarchaeum subterraneum TaxID=311458 RepID=A0A833EC11_CALS0|nr:formate dehydrogenase [Candidatus Caldarchaeum subterraneum]